MTVFGPTMRFVPNKNCEQQAVLALHQARQGFVKARTAQANHIRGLLFEYGIVIAQGMGDIAKRLPEILEDVKNDLPGVFRQLLARLGDHLKELDRQVGEFESQIQCWHQENDASRKLAQIPGIGPITASALIASVGDARNFENGRQLPAWLGLVFTLMRKEASLKRGIEPAQIVCPTTGMQYARPAKVELFPASVVLLADYRAS